MLEVQSRLCTGKFSFRRFAICLVPLGALALGACTTGTPAGPGEFNDPYENTNRKIHSFNKSMDTGIYRPVSNAYGTVVPIAVRTGVNNVSETIDLPRRVVNSLLQGDVETGVHNTFRFLLNATLGVAGIFDPATSFGVEERDTDFGETLHVWGVGEGAYLAVPFFGPSNQRDLAGDVVDLVTNPLSYVLTPPQSYVGPGSTLGENADYRYTFQDTVDGILYDSADSYAQSRVIYLESRRFELGIPSGGGTGEAEDDIFDPYEDF